MSNETKWTPEPWVVEWNTYLGEYQVAAFSEDGNRVLQVLIRSFSQDADTSLIAQAPRMYEALEKAVGCLEINMVNACDGISVDEMKQIMAAARGEE